jgi:hypothetical protein
MRVASSIAKVPEVPGYSTVSPTRLAGTRHGTAELSAFPGLMRRTAAPDGLAATIVSPNNPIRWPSPAGRLTLPFCCMCEL